jgi:nitric oxide reductase NorQ protein
MDELGLLQVAPGVVFFATLNEGAEFVGTELLDPALRDRFYVTTMDFLPNEVEMEVLEKKTGVTNEQAREIITVANSIRANADLGVDVSTRKILMLGEMIAAGGTLREAIVTSLQTDKKTLESVLLSLHVNLGKVEKSKTEYVQYIAA